MTGAERLREVERLRRNRPRDRFLRSSVGILAAGVVGVWIFGNLGVADFWTPRRSANLHRFLGEIVPYPLHEDPSLGGLLEWLGANLPRGLEAAWTTLLLSVAAIVLAGLLGALLSLPAARSFSQTRLPGSVGSGRRLAWSTVGRLTRWALRFARAIPEYVWAFFFIALVGPSAWPVILALAIHNGSILGRLGAEVVDDLSPDCPRALRALGASRLQTAWVAIFPQVLGRWLLFFFYRWETCVREATVLGMLGIFSLGYQVQDARARQHLDEMVLLIFLGGLLVLVGDMVSVRVRGRLRNAG